MADTARSNLQELKDISVEIHNLNKQLKDLRARKKELEKEVVEYLETKDKPAVKFHNVVFQVVPKNQRGRKKKDEKLIDGLKVLEKYGISESKKALDEVLEAMKGENSTVSTLKMKAASIYEM